MQIDALGENYVYTLTTKSWIARYLFHMEQFYDAEKIFKIVENMPKEVLGEKHANTQSAKSWIAF